MARQVSMVDETEIWLINCNVMEFKNRLNQLNLGYCLPYKVAGMNKGYVGELYGVTVAHIVSPTDKQPHTESLESCWCYEEKE